jgi:hypothetical protein
MFVPQRKRIFGPPQAHTGTALLFNLVVNLRSILRGSRNMGSVQHIVSTLIQPHTAPHSPIQPHTARAVGIAFRYVIRVFSFGAGGDASGIWTRLVLRGPTRSRSATLPLNLECSSLGTFRARIGRPSAMQRHQLPAQKCSRIPHNTVPLRFVSEWVELILRRPHT